MIYITVLITCFAVCDVVELFALCKLLEVVFKDVEKDFASILERVIARNVRCHEAVRSCPEWMICRKWFRS